MIVSEQSESNYPKQPWFVYICKAKTNRYYTGITNNPSARLDKHNSGTGSKFARDQGAFTLLYVSPPFTKAEARKHEIQVKGWTRTKKERLIGGEWT